MQEKKNTSELINFVINFILPVSTGFCCFTFFSFIYLPNTKFRVHVLIYPLQQIKAQWNERILVVTEMIENTQKLIN